MTVSTNTPADKKLKVLLIVEQCNPEWFSVPLVGYCFYEGIARYADVTLVTHLRNKAALEKVHPNEDIVYIHEGACMQMYSRTIEAISNIGGKVAWPLQNALGFPVYAAFNRKVYQQFSDKVLKGDYDLVHALTPMMPRYPVKIVRACKTTPFVLGPVNGGVPFPKGFAEVASQEFAYLNFLRSFARLVPGYSRTYKEADYILSGSSYTLGMIKDMFGLSDDRIKLFYENGLKQFFLNAPKKAPKKTPKKVASGSHDKPINLLFVGRLVPYKGADMLVEALGLLDKRLLQRCTVTIVGDGSERTDLESSVEKNNLTDIVHFTGWVEQDDTLAFYSQADVFCFPSVREFGGAVVLEAMANGLPCIVVDHGGIGEYVTAETGFKIEPHSRQHVVNALVEHLSQLIEDDQLRSSMSSAATKHVQNFTWDAKAKDVIAIYQKVLKKA